MVYRAILHELLATTSGAFAAIFLDYEGETVELVCDRDISDHDLRIIGATVTTAFNATNAAHGSRDQDDKRRALNGFIKTSGLFDAVVDFDAVTLDPSTGEMKPEFVPESTTGGPGDKLHPNRAGYLAMGEAIDLGIFGVGQ